MDAQTFDRVVELAQRQGQLRAELAQVEAELATLRPGHTEHEAEDEDDEVELDVTPRAALPAPKRKRADGAFTAEEVLALFEREKPRDMNAVEVGKILNVPTKLAGNRISYLSRQGLLSFVSRGRYRAK